MPFERGVAIVTGAASGISASAELFAREASLSLRWIAPGKMKTPPTQSPLPVPRLGNDADASSEEDVARVIDTAVKQFGKLGRVYANAGVIGTSKRFLELALRTGAMSSGEHARRLFAIKHAARVMIPNKARPSAPRRWPGSLNRRERAQRQQSRRHQHGVGRRQRSHRHQCADQCDPPG
jgi:NAD(P)-dependent dehydrogenase (short-subunit alcohol dehydrogenase family)